MKFFHDAIHHMLELVGPQNGSAMSAAGDICTVDATVAKYAHAKHNLRSFHYFYVPLASGDNLRDV